MGIPADGEKERRILIKRNVKFMITEDAVIPSTPQYGGVKGEHNATLLGILLSNNRYEDGDVVRLSFTAGNGKVLLSEILTDITTSDAGAYIDYTLPRLLTDEAGDLFIRVWLSRMENGQEVERYGSPDMVLYLEEADVKSGVSMPNTASDGYKGLWREDGRYFNDKEGGIQYGNRDQGRRLAF